MGGNRRTLLGKEMFCSQVLFFCGCLSLPASTDAVLACEFRTESEPAPRIEWKKKGKDVSFVYFEGKFIGGYQTIQHILPLLLHALI